jgi:hypothetical protein
MPQNSRKKDIFWYFWTISPTRMGILIWLGAFFQTKTLGHTFCLRAGLCVPFWVHLGLPKCPKTAFFRLFWLFSFTRMGLLILLGAYFQAKTLGQTSCPNEPKKGTQRPASMRDVWPNVLV